MYFRQSVISAIQASSEINSPFDDARHGICQPKPPAGIGYTWQQ
jgi:hypothetical protein